MKTHLSLPWIAAFFITISLIEFERNAVAGDHDIGREPSIVAEDGDFTPVADSSPDKPADAAQIFCVTSVAACINACPDNRYRIEDNNYCAGAKERPTVTSAKVACSCKTD